MSPNHSLTSRLRSASKTSNGRPDFDVDAFVSRNGPGKSSTRSARSTKMSLTEIAETEPTTLTNDALDKAERLPSHNEHEEKNETGAKPSGDVYHGDASTDAFHKLLDNALATGAPSDSKNGDNTSQMTSRQELGTEEDRPATPRSTMTYDLNDAFGDFDGVHCEPDFGYFEDVPMPEPEPMPEPQSEQPFSRPDMPRPQSYFDMQTGQQMMYYPARVPAMLNLPPKLSRKPKAAIRNARHSKVLQAMGHPGLGQAEYMERGSHAPPPLGSTPLARSKWTPTSRLTWRIYHRICVPAPFSNCRPSRPSAHYKEMLKTGAGKDAKARGAILTSVEVADIIKRGYETLSIQAKEGLDTWERYREADERTLLKKVARVAVADGRGLVGGSR
ncbi:hypothetical protein BN1723_013364 [Verticillium longisporum]|uniref:Armadillo-like helical domain-containing protein n=1 Tax=Verticillium longisporum TaxID=100787 RepID=A0A0G4LRU1_VERLO|nr:hypothetical protein BN1723_013364 [Verticillium longisporum]